MTEPVEQPWRVGRKVGRTIYAHATDDPDGDGVLIGMMDTPALAAEAVTTHNERLKGDHFETMLRRVSMRRDGDPDGGRRGD